MGPVLFRIYVSIMDFCVAARVHSVPKSLITCDRAIQRKFCKRLHIGETISCDRVTHFGKIG